MPYRGYTVLASVSGKADAVDAAVPARALRAFHLHDPNALFLKIEADTSTPGKVTLVVGKTYPSSMPPRPSAVHQSSEASEHATPSRRPRFGASRSPIARDNTQADNQVKYLDRPAPAAAQHFLLHTTKVSGTPWEDQAINAIPIASSQTDHAMYVIGVSAPARPHPRSSLWARGTPPTRPPPRRRSRSRATPARVPWSRS